MLWCNPPLSLFNSAWQLRLVSWFFFLFFWATMLIWHVKSPFVAGQPTSLPCFFPKPWILFEFFDPEVQVCRALAVAMSPHIAFHTVGMHLRASLEDVILWIAIRTVEERYGFVQALLMMISCDCAKCWLIISLTQCIISKTRSQQLTWHSAQSNLVRRERGVDALIWSLLSRHKKSWPNWVLKLTMTTLRYQSLF